MSVAVLGSANVDRLLRVPHLPAPGETLLARGADRLPGGKGANQAVAAARAGGARTTLIGAVGTDDDGELLRAALTSAGVRTGLLRAVAEPTGLALVLVDDAGQNSIVVASGANATVRSLTDAERDAIAAADVLLTQLELPVEVVAEGVAAARRAGRRVVLNAAPAAPLPDPLWAAVDVLVVNETEASELAGEPGLDDAVAALLDRVPLVVATLGGDGVLLAERGSAARRRPAHRVEAVDTTGAGDTFCGVLAAALAAGADVDTAAGRATAAAALSVQRAGAIPSIPTAEEVQQIVERGT